MRALTCSIALFRSSRGRLRQVPSGRVARALRPVLLALGAIVSGGLEYLLQQIELTWNRLRLLSRDEAGYTTQTVIMTAILAALAIAAGAIIYTKVVNKANSINLDGNSGSQ